jgi:hypothetical protein
MSKGFKGHGPKQQTVIFLTKDHGRGGALAIHGKDRITKLSGDLPSASVNVREL